MYKTVVICFHFSIFVLLETAHSENQYCLQCCDLLSFQYLCLIGNSWPTMNTPAVWCCDLLSFQYLCLIGNSHRLKIYLDESVVICFHFSIFVLLETAAMQGLTPPACCDLLSFQYLCLIGNSSFGADGLESVVVICFHFSIFVLLETAWKRHRRTMYEL